MKEGKHPGIVELKETFLEADPPCLMYEYVEGGDLAGLIQQEKAQTGHGVEPTAAAKISPGGPREESIHGQSLPSRQPQTVYLGQHALVQKTEVDDHILPQMASYQGRIRLG